MSDGAQISPTREWCHSIPVQQQSVLFLAGRGPDGVAKRHPCKPIHIAYRACVFVAGKYGRFLEWGERADSFMSLDVFADKDKWTATIDTFFDHYDELPQHYVKHLMHGAQILGYKHPDQRFRERWNLFYLRLVESFHLTPETEAEMDERLSDWDRRDW